MPGRSAGNCEGRLAIAPPSAAPPAAPAGDAEEIADVARLGRWPGWFRDRFAMPAPGLAGSCDGRSGRLHRPIRLAPGDPAPPGRSAARDDLLRPAGPVRSTGSRTSCRSTWKLRRPRRKDPATRFARARSARQPPGRVWAGWMAARADPRCSALPDGSCEAPPTAEGRLSPEGRFDQRGHATATWPPRAGRRGV